MQNMTECRKEERLMRSAEERLSFSGISSQEFRRRRASFESNEVRSQKADKGERKEGSFKEFQEKRRVFEEFRETKTIELPTKPGLSLLRTIDDFDKYYKHEKSKPENSYFEDLVLRKQGLSKIQSTYNLRKYFKPFESDAGFEETKTERTEEILNPEKYTERFRSKFGNQHSDPGQSGLFGSSPFEGTTKEIKIEKITKDVRKGADSPTNLFERSIFKANSPEKDQKDFDELFESNSTLKSKVQKDFDELFESSSTLKAKSKERKTDKDFDKLFTSSVTPKTNTFTGKDHTKIDEYFAAARKKQEQLFSARKDRFLKSQNKNGASDLEQDGGRATIQKNLARDLRKNSSSVDDLTTIFAKLEKEKGLNKSERKLLVRRSLDDLSAGFHADFERKERKMASQLEEIHRMVADMAAMSSRLQTTEMFRDRARSRSRSRSGLPPSPSPSSSPVRTSGHVHNNRTSPNNSPMRTPYVLNRTSPNNSPVRTPYTLSNGASPNSTPVGTPESRRRNLSRSTSPSPCSSPRPQFRMSSRTMLEEVVHPRSPRLTSIDRFLPKVEKRFESGCLFEKRTMPTRYSSTITLRMGSTWRRYNEQVTLQSRMVPTRFCESVETPPPSPRKHYTTRLEIDCDENRDSTLSQPLVYQQILLPPDSRTPVFI